LTVKPFSSLVSGVVVPHTDIDRHADTQTQTERDSEK
jgi:hypothetical protein